MFINLNIKTIFKNYKMFIFINNSSDYEYKNKSNLSNDINNMQSVFYKIELYLSFFPIILLAFGTFGNLLAFYILTRKKLRTQSTMIYFASLTLLDTISLYQW